MTKKCIYCNIEIPAESVIDFCHKCGKNVWGEKMFYTILKNMEEAREKGDLYPLGSFMETSKNSTENKKFDGI